MKKRKSEECFKCGKRGHKVVECRKFNCYKCGGNGHLAKDYPNRPKRQKEQS